MSRTKDRLILEARRDKDADDWDRGKEHAREERELREEFDARRHL